MKKNIVSVFIIVIIILVVIFAILIVNINTINSHKREIKAFNAEYEDYNKDGLNGLDITTVINKAVSHNEKYYVQKDQKGYYVEDDDRIEIYVIFNKTPYEMERINKVGIESFISNFGAVEFACCDITYHSSGKVATMTFEARDY